MVWKGVAQVQLHTENTEQAQTCECWKPLKVDRLREPEKTLHQGLLL